MADNSLLENLYSQLTDEQLLNKIFDKIEQLTPEALTIAKNEIKRRRLDFEQLENAQNTKNELKQDYAQFKEGITKNKLLLLINNIINDKSDNKTDEAIISDFEREGIKRGITLLLIAEAKEKCIAIIEETRIDRLLGGIIASLSIVVVIAANHFSNGIIIYLPIGTFLYGFFRFVKGIENLSKQKKMKEIIKNF